MHTLQNILSFMIALNQGWAASVLEARCPAEFSSNPNQTHLPSFLVILKTLISLFRCVWLWS